MEVQTVSYRDPQAGRKFTESIKHTGFAVVTDHPIPKQLIFGSYEDWDRFFASPAKHDYKFNPQTQTGYFPFKSENAKDSSFKDLKEFFHLYKSKDVPKELSTKTWELFNKLDQLAGELLTWIDDATPSDIKKYFSMPLSKMIQPSDKTLFRILHYPPLSGGEHDGEIRAAAHEDINLITLLPAATAPGLEVKDLKGNWIAVPCDPGSIIVNAGDMLQEASQGYYVSTTHRVVNPKGEAAKKSRYSMPLFLHPNSSVRLSERYTAQSYLEQRLRELGLK